MTDRERDLLWWVLHCLDEATHSIRRATLEGSPSERSDYQQLRADLAAVVDAISCWHRCYPPTTSSR
jgi:hypothetical protein